MLDRREAIKKITLTSGAVISCAVLTSTLSACTTKETTLTWSPQFFSIKDAALIANISEVIIPKGSNVSANDVNVPQFIDLLFGDVFDNTQKLRFKAGIKQFLKQFSTNHNEPFLDAAPATQNSFTLALYNQNYDTTQTLLNLVAQQNVASEHQATYELYSFLITLRELVINSFFTSEYVGEQLLAYDPIPGGYIGCMPLTPQTKVWSVT